MHDGAWREVNRVQDELIRVLRLDVVALQHMIREVAQVERDDGLRVGANGGREHVPIIRIGKIESVFEVLVAIHNAVWYHLAHQASGPLERRWWEIGTLCHDAIKAFIENAFGPACAYHTGIRDAQEEIPNRGGIQDARIVDDDERHGAQSL